MDDLDNILNEAPVEAIEQPQEQPAIEQEAEQPRAPDGKFAPKGNDDGAMPAPEDDAKQVPIGSYKAEKQKRQELENQIEALRREMEQRNQEPAPPPPSIWEDDQAALGHVRDSAVQQAVQQATYNARLDMSEMMARQANPDFEDIKAEFLQMAQTNPTLAQQALADPHPWQKAYQIAKNVRAANELGATNLEELKAQLLEQLKAEQGQMAPPAVNLPRSLADAQSARGGNTPTQAPLTLEEILGR